MAIDGHGDGRTDGQTRAEERADRETEGRCNCVTVLPRVEC